MTYVSTQTIFAGNISPLDRESKLIKTLAHLNRTFKHITGAIPAAIRTKTGITNLRYRLETEFAHLINDLQASPACLQQFHIGACNNYIDQILSKDSQL